MNENPDNSYSWNAVFESHDVIDNDYIRVKIMLGYYVLGFHCERYDVLWFHCEQYDFLLSFRIWALLGKRLHQEAATTALWRRG